jgi:HD-like signal output (HDOD) protein
MNLQDWLAELAPAEIPVFNHTLERLAELDRQRDDVSAPDVAAEVLSDPLFTLRVIHAVNARKSRLFDSEIATVEGALIMQGINAFLDQMGSLMTVEQVFGRETEVMRLLYALLREVQHAAWQARDFSALRLDVRAEEVQVAAMLHYAPTFLICLRDPDSATRLLLPGRELPTAETQRQALGITLYELGAPLLASWKIPELIRDLLDERGDLERPRHAILAACLRIADLSRRGWWQEEMMEPYLTLARVSNRPVEAVISTVHANAARSARHGAWIPAPPAAAWLPMLPGGWPEDADGTKNFPTQMTEVSVNAALERPTLPRPPAVTIAIPSPPPETRADAPAPEPAAEVCPMPDRAAFRESLRGIEQHLDGSLNINQMSAVILKGLHAGLGLSRILFAMVTPDGTRVKCRFSLGIAKEDPLRHFEFPLGSRDLFGQLMTKMQGVWLNGETRDRLWPLVSPNLQALIGDGEFYAMSLFAGGKAIGMIYADRGRGGCGLDPLSYTDFKMLCLQAARGLGQVKT